MSLSTSSEPLSSKKAPELTLIQRINIPIHVALRPAQWLCCLSKARRADASWQCSATTVEEVMQALVTAAETNGFIVRSSSGTFFRCVDVTPAGWVDVLEVRLAQKGADVDARCWGQSTGIVPTKMPFSWLLSAAFCWVPFADWGNNLTHLRQLKDGLPCVVAETVSCAGKVPPRVAEARAAAEAKKNQV